MMAETMLPLITTFHAAFSTVHALNRAATKAKEMNGKQEY
jgi:hypothetical protein